MTYRVLRVALLRVAISKSRYRHSERKLEEGPLPSLTAQFPRRYPRLLKNSPLPLVVLDWGSKTPVSDL